MSTGTGTVACPVCGGTDAVDRWRVDTAATENGVNADTFRPSADRFGATAARVLRCTRCGHGYVDAPPPADDVATAYEDAADPVSLREEDGQVETARRALVGIERVVVPGRVVDLGCWTGSFLVAARERGWDPVGVEPSTWAADRARARGLDVRTTVLERNGLPDASCRLVVLCDVLEHLTDPAAALAEAARLLEPGGALYVTVPDAGSLVARAMGRRWWSVLPMHLQYFDRAGLRRVVEDAAFEVREVTSHPKVFTARYYAERAASFVAPLRPIVDRFGRTRSANRLVAPDFRDRVALLAVKRPIRP